MEISNQHRGAGAPPSQDEPLQPVSRERILDSLSDGIFTVDHRWRITSFNRAAERITGYSSAEVLGQPCREVFHSDVCDDGCPLRRTMLTGRSVVSERVRAVDRHGRFIWMSIGTGVLRGQDNEAVGGVQSFRDMTDRQQFGIEGEEFPDVRQVVANDPQMHRVVEVLPQLAASGAPILITGPRGAGKDLIARVLHTLSHARCFVRVSCGALPEHLLERELFGRGGGNESQQGAMSKVTAGTVLLDDVDALPLRLQARVIEVWKRLRADAQREPCKGRLMATTRKDLRLAVRQGTFRNDLFALLAELQVHVPSLAKHAGDIPPLVSLFLRQQRTGQSSLKVSSEVMALLRAYEYEENVRELKAVVEYASAVCTDTVIEPRHLPSHMREMAFDAQSQQGMGPLQSAEADVIRRMLTKYKGNRTEAAKALGMHRTTLWRKIRQYEIGDFGTPAL